MGAAFKTFEFETQGLPPGKDLIEIGGESVKISATFGNMSLWITLTSNSTDSGDDGGGDRALRGYAVDGGDGDFDLRGDGVDGSDGLLSGDGFLDALGGDEVFAGND